MNWIVKIWSGKYGRNIPKGLLSFICGEDPGFTDYANKNFSLRKGANVFEKIPGFEPIPFHEIGIREDKQ